MFNFLFKRLFKCDFREFYISGDKLGVRCSNEQMHKKVKVEKYGGIHDSFRITNTLVCLFCDCNKKKQVEKTDEEREDLFDEFDEEPVDVVPDKVDVVPDKVDVDVDLDKIEHECEEELLTPGTSLIHSEDENEYF